MATITIPLEQVREGDRVHAVASDAHVEIRGVVARDLSLRLPAPSGRILLDLSTEGERARAASWWTLTVERDVPDLPTEPAVVFRAKAMGSVGTLVSVLRNGSIEYVDNDGNRYSAAAIEPGTVKLATITWGAEA